MGNLAQKEEKMRMLFPTCCPSNPPEWRGRWGSLEQPTPAERSLLLLLYLARAPRDSAAGFVDTMAEPAVPCWLEIYPQ